MVNYQNILIARDYRGITQKQLADGIGGLSQGTLSRIEKGLYQVADDVLQEIAKVLDFPVTFFYKETPKYPAFYFNYRRRATMPQKKLIQLEAYFDIMRMAIDELGRSVDIPEYKLPVVAPNEKLTPEDIANRVRCFMRLKRGPIDNLINSLELNGIVVCMVPIDNDQFDGITMITNSNYRIIFINDNLSNDRKRFSIGHELGHLIMHDPDVIDDKSMDDKEKEANKFSAEFNMPKIDCFNDLKGLRFADLGMLKQRWYLSKAAIIYRAKELHTIQENTAKYYQMQLSAAGERKVEKGFVPLDTPKIIQKMVQAHLDELGYSVAELSYILGLNQEDFNKYLGSKSSENIVRIKPIFFKRDD